MNWIGGSLPNSNHSSSLVPFETVNSNHQLDIHRNCKSVICVIWWIRLHQLDPSDLHQLDIPVLAYITNDMQMICKLGRIELAAIFFYYHYFFPPAGLDLNILFYFLSDGMFLKMFIGVAAQVMESTGTVPALCHHGRVSFEQSELIF